MTIPPGDGYDPNQPQQHHPQGQQPHQMAPHNAPGQVPGPGQYGYGTPPSPAPIGPYDPIQAFTWSFKKIFEYPAVMIGLALIPLVALLPIFLIVFPVLIQASAPDPVTGQPPTEMPEGFGLIFALYPLMAVVSIVSSIAFTKAGSDAANGREVSFGNAFKGISWGAAIGGLIVAGFIGSLGVILCYVGVLLTMPFTMLLVPLIIDQGMSIGDAFSKSLEIAKANFGKLVVLLLLSIVASLVPIIGSIAYMLALVYTSRVMTGQPVAPAA